jgi:hypothetical protein
MPGTVAAELGNPSTTQFNGLSTILDTLHHRPKHAISATWTSLPTPLSGNTPSISDIAVLNRGDALILYLPAVKGAADYRAYIYDSSKVTFSGTQPRGAVIACAGYRQRWLRNIDALMSGGYEYVTAKNRELIQTIEVPGLTTDGDYKVIVEALASPCPFPGILAHTNAAIPLFNSTRTFNFRSFADIKSIYGNEILNGQGSALDDFKNVFGPNRELNAALASAVPPQDPKIPADPTVIARSAITVVRPAADEAVNAPNIDVGSNAIFDSFANDAIMDPAAFTTIRNEGSGLARAGKFGDWFFWTNRIQGAVGNNPELGVQVWQRHGRLYTTFGDNGQFILGAVYFMSTKTLPQQLDTSQYVHSFFRIDSGATERRYWHWLMCGADTRDELVDPSTHIPRNFPVGTPFFNLVGNGYNVSSPMEGETENQYHKKECLNLIQIGSSWIFGKPSGASPSWFDEPHSQLNAFINPAGTLSGIINLKPDGVPDYDPDAAGGMLFRLNANKQATQPMFEPFDQMAPLTHFDIFVRPDRVIFYINGRQAWCGDLSERPLTMKYGMIGYGSVLYHSSAELDTNYGNGAGGTGGNFHYIMNTPWSDTRAWDAVGHTEKIDIPSQFTFDPAACFKPKSTAVR